MRKLNELEKKGYNAQFRKRRPLWEHTIKTYTGNRESNLVSWLSAGAVILLIIMLFATT